MFGIAPSEILVVVLVAIVVIGPKDLPLALRTAGRWIGKMQRMSSHLRAGIDEMIRQAELEEMEKTWREHNAKIIAEGEAAVAPGAPAALAHPAATAEAGAARGAGPQPEPAAAEAQPGLPL